jgi:asparagine N-glycosylation enzyme membrane subunit Stt3
MDTNIVLIIVGGLALLVIVFIARKILRLAIKLTLVGIVIVALLAGAGVGWWRGWFSSSSQTKPQHRTAPAHPTSSR